MNDVDGGAGLEPQQGDRLVVVFAASHVEADLVRAALQGHGIPAVMEGEGFHGAYPVTVGSMGEGRVLVPEDRGQEALEIIGALDDDEEVFEPEVFAEQTSKGWTWWVALFVSIALILLLVVEIRN